MDHANLRLILLSHVQTPTEDDFQEADDLRRQFLEDLEAAHRNGDLAELHEKELHLKLEQIKHRKSALVDKLRRFHRQILSSGGIQARYVFPILNSAPLFYTIEIDAF